MKLTLVKTITAHKSLVNSIILLQDGRIASGNDDYIIKIFDPDNNYNCVPSISNDGQIKSLCQLDNGNIVSSGYSKLFICSFSKTSSTTASRVAISAFFALDIILETTSL